MKDKLKIIAKFLISWLCSFIVIYLFVFFGGYKFFESGDIILQEVGVAFIVGAVVYFLAELHVVNSKKIYELEKRIEELERMK